MLKKAKLKKQIKLLKERRAELDAELQTLETRSKELEQIIEDVTSEEDLTTIDTEIDDVLSKRSKLDTDIQENNQAIEELEKELREHEEIVKTIVNKVEKKEERKIMNYEKMTLRQAIMEDNEVRSYFEDFAQAIQTRAVSDFAKATPQFVIDLINEKLKEKSVLLPLVRTIKLHGQARILVDGEDTDAIWLEQTGALKELEFNIDQLEFDGYKIGGFATLYNSQVEDAIFNVAEYIIDKLAQSIKNTLEKTILFGKGSTEKMPDGIVTKLLADTATKATNLIKTAKGKTELKDFITLHTAIAKHKKLSTGKPAYIMNEVTYLNLIVGKVMENEKLINLMTFSPNKFPVTGVDIVITEAVPENVVIMGYFNEYFLIERSSLAIKLSEEVKFVEDKTIIKALQRFDGKPKSAKLFSVLLAEGAEESVLSPTFKKQ